MLVRRLGDPRPTTQKEISTNTPHMCCSGVDWKGDRWRYLLLAMMLFDYAGNGAGTTAVGKDASRSDWSIPITDRGHCQA